MRSYSVILEVSLHCDGVNRFLIFKDHGNVVYTKPINGYEYREEFFQSLPGYFECCENNGEYLIRCKALVVSKEKWNRIPRNYKGTFSDYSGKHPEWKGRATVLSGCVSDAVGSLLIEGVHFVIV